MGNETGIGASVNRLEDARFLTGQGRFVGDITLPGQTYADGLGGIPCTQLQGDG